MTVIDFHNHLGVDLGAELSQTADELLARLDEARIDRAVVFPFPAARTWPRVTTSSPRPSASTPTG